MPFPLHRPDLSRVSYDNLMSAAGPATGSAAAANAGATTKDREQRQPGADVSGSGSPPGAHGRGGSGGGGFTEVRLRRRLSEHQGAYAYKIKVLTADRLNAGLGSTTVRTRGRRGGLAVRPFGQCAARGGGLDDAESDRTRSATPPALFPRPAPPQVYLELLGRTATVCQALPRGKGSFGRGCCDRFTLYSHEGDMGPILAIKVGRGAGAGGTRALV